MVDALPYLVDYPYGCTEQTLNRFLPTVITQKMLQRHEARPEGRSAKKRTNLNAQEIGDDQERAKQWKRFDRNPVFDEDELDRMVKAGVQGADRTCSSPTAAGAGSAASASTRWPHTTAVVVHGLQIAKAERRGPACPACSSAASTG